jgi:hypothetical protein
VRVASPHTGHSVTSEAYGTVPGSANSSCRTSRSVGPPSRRSQLPEYGEDQAHTVVRCRSASPCANALMTAARVGRGPRTRAAARLRPWAGPERLPRPRPASRYGAHVGEPVQRDGDGAVPADLALVGVCGQYPPGRFHVPKVGRVPSRRVRGSTGWNRGEPEEDVALAGGVADGLGCDRGARQRGNEMTLKP